MRVLVSVPIKSLRAPRDMHVLNGGAVISHLRMLHGMLALRGASCTQDERALGARCMAKVLLEILPRLVTVRAQPCRATPLSRSLLIQEDALRA